VDTTEDKAVEFLKSPEIQKQIKALAAKVAKLSN
jgi:hypothetical protein